MTPCKAFTNLFCETDQSRSCRPDAWGRVSFLTTPVSIVGWIYDPNHFLTAGMYVDVPHLDCLLVAAPITVEGLELNLRKRPWSQS
jgi:hypothetical protein